MSGTRQRGVCASRAKLDKRMVALGLKSQAELARRIASLEGLDAPPKDLVNRVFRQQRVDHATLDRVAAALEIDSYLLYLTTADQRDEIENPCRDAVLQSPAQAATTEASSKRPGSRRLLWVGRMILPGLMLAALLLVWGQAASKFAAPEPVGATEQPVLNSLLVPRQRSLYPLLNPLLQRNDQWRLALLPEAFFGLSDPAQMRAQFEVDQLLFVDVAAVAGINVLVFQGDAGVRTPVLQTVVLSDNEMQSAQDYLAASFDDLLGNRVAENALPSSSLGDARHEARARSLAQRSFDSASLAEAAGLLAQVEQPSAISWAVQCQMHVTSAWQRDERAGFELARQACEQAVALDDAHPFVMAVDAYRLMRNGQYEQSDTVYRGLLARYPEHLEALLGAAELAMQRALQSPDSYPDGLDSAILLAARASEIAPGDWRPYQQLTTYFYLLGDTEAALEATDRVNQLSPHQLSLANGALLSLCFSRMAQAEAYAQQLLDIDSGSYLAHETLFYIAAYQRRPEAALAAMERAMLAFDDEAGGLHLQWGQLADAYRWSGETQQAVVSYRRALQEFAQDRAKRQLSANDEVYGLYYQQALYRLLGEGAPADAQTFLQQVDLSGLSSSQQYKAAVLLGWLGQEALSRQALELAQQACSVYRDGWDVRRS